jgi:biofilm PGA synthesis N-glycosyltransferase PgaC
MILALSICFVLLFAYALILLWLASGFARTPVFEPHPGAAALPVTIIVCARNEEKNITACLRSVLNQDYAPEKIQLILMNDASSDSTVQRAEAVLKYSGLQYRIISNPQQKGKKQSITYAMTLATGDLVILRDADTFTNSQQWLYTLVQFRQHSKVDLIIAPVAIADNFGILWALQAIENNILAVLAGGSSFYRRPFLCSGANLAFPKATFEKTKGYASHLDKASGDDIFFMEDVKKIPGSTIAYLKSSEAIVSTYPSYSFKALIRQKTRWASKFKTNPNRLNFWLALLSFGVNAAWLVCFVGCFLSVSYHRACLLFIFLKLGIDFLLLFLASGFIKNRLLWWFALPVGCIYPMYACLVSFASVFMKPRWK